MRLPRPSSASNQSTAHIINQVFGDVMHEGSLVTAEMIENLKTSKDDSDNVHAEYVEKLQKVSFEYKMCLFFTLIVNCLALLHCYTI